MAIREITFSDVKQGVPFYIQENDAFDGLFNKFIGKKLVYKRQVKDHNTFQIILVVEIEGRLDYITLTQECFLDFSDNFKFFTCDTEEDEFALRLGFDQ